MTSFDLLLLYIGSTNGKIFKKLLTLSDELDMIIFVSYKSDNCMDHDLEAKAWYLVDDGIDHINSVNSLQNPNIVGILVTYDNKQEIDLYGERCIKRSLKNIDVIKITSIKLKYGIIKDPNRVLSFERS